MSTSQELDSSGDEEKVLEESMYSEKSKLRLKNAVIYYEELLAENNLIASESSATLSHEAMLIGRELYESTLEMLDEKKLVTEEELIHVNEVCEEIDFEKIKDDDSSDEYKPEAKKSREMEHVPLDYKVKVINITKAHPTWSLQTLQKKGCHRLKKLEYLPQWKEDILKGGNTLDKYSVIDSWTYDRFVEARQSYQQVTTRNLQQWALAAAGQYPDFEFKASDRWITKFKKRHGIRQQTVIKFVSQEEAVTIEETLASARIFRVQTLRLIPNFNEDYIINTDQTECQYQSILNKSLTEKGSKTVFMKRQDMNKVTHSYTAQYAITLSGRVLPRVFVCLQEATDTFEPKVQMLVDEYAKKYKNVILMSSKSGKLTTSLYNNFLNDCLKSYVGKEKFLLLIDSWRGQTKPELYDEIFQDDNKMPTCTVKVIPPKCTAIVQPCDVYFHRQVKNLIKRIQNCADLIEQKRDINSREDCIKLQSIVHHQLSSPLFCDMIKYSWYASKLSNERKIFMNVNDVCFPMDLHKILCSCKKSPFICCAICRDNLCFSCFYDDYHSGYCIKI